MTSTTALSLASMDVWRSIALTDVTLWYNLIRVVPGLYSRRDREELKQKDVRVVEMDGDFTHYLGELIHRDRGEGPAVIKRTGTKMYYKMGKIHRRFEDGPAVETYNGTKIFFREGRPRMGDDPVVITPDGAIFLGKEAGMSVEKDVIVLTRCSRDSERQWTVPIG